MSALVGFTGNPDRELLNRMLAQLNHRGTLIDSPLETEVGSVAVCEWPNRTVLGNVQSGYRRKNRAQWAVSGFLFNELPSVADTPSLRALRGCFCVACIQDGHLTIARDAVGTQSLYYGRLGKRWLIATEPKAITSEVGFVSRIRPAAIAQYLSFSFVPGRGTMLDDLFEAEAGHLVSLRSNREPRIERYFYFESEEEEYAAALSTTEQEWTRQTRTVIEAAVSERLSHSKTDEHAVLLSGGLDSSIVAAEVARQSTKPIRTFSIHFGPQYPNELAFAKSVADRVGSRHEEVLVQPKSFLPRFRQMIWHLDEPIGDPITQPNFELAGHVARNFDVAFNGEGGDPLFGGPKNLTMMLAHWYGGIQRPANFREQAYLASYRRAYDEWFRLLSPDLREQIDPERDLESVLTPFFSVEPPRSFLNKLMAINIRLKGASLILPKVDRMFAAHRLTPLSPLFDDRLTRLSFRMPPKMKLRMGNEKYVLKEAYRGELPKPIIDRPKSGMRVPVHFWFRGELRRYARSLFSKRRVQQTGMFDAERVQRILDYDTEEGPGRYGMRLWMLMTFEIWRRIVVEGESI